MKTTNVCLCLLGGHVQNPPNRIREPITDRGLGETVIVKNNFYLIQKNI